MLRIYVLKKSINSAGFEPANHGSRGEHVTPRPPRTTLRDKLTRKRSLGRPRHRWEDNIRVDVKEIDINTRNWVDSTQDRDY